MSLSKGRTNPVGMSPWSREIPKLYHSSWAPVGSLGVFQGETHGEANNKCTIHRSKNTYSDLLRAYLLKGIPSEVLDNTHKSCIIIYYSKLFEAFAMAFERFEDRRSISSVGWVSEHRALGCGFEPWPEQQSGSLIKEQGSASFVIKSTNG